MVPKKVPKKAAKKAAGKKAAPKKAAPKKAAPKKAAGKAAVPTDNRGRPRVTAERRRQMQQLRQAMDEAVETAAETAERIGELADARLVEMLTGLAPADKDLIAAVKLAMQRVGRLTQRAEHTHRGDPDQPMGMVVVPAQMGREEWQDSVRQYLAAQATSAAPPDDQ